MSSPRAEAVRGYWWSGEKVKCMRMFYGRDQSECSQINSLEGDHGQEDLHTQLESHSTQVRDKGLQFIADFFISL